MVSNGHGTQTAGIAAGDGTNGNQTGVAPEALILCLRNDGGGEVSAFPVPEEYHLNQNFPNPFNPETEIRFALPEAESIRLTVYDVLGQETAVLIDGEYPAGAHSVTFNAANLSSGIYFYHLEAGVYSAVKKMTLMK
ncbi:S8 family peptidase [bacterium]|nr:S8 family peptidase [FCB group bacterium]MBL7191615.1 S8 family peptidase [bacterium]